MTLTAIQGADLWLGFPISLLSGLASLTSASYTNTMTFDAANDQCAVVFQAPRTGTIYDVEFSLAASTLTGTLRVGFVTLSGAQFPGSPGTYANYADIVNPTAGWQAPSGYLGTGGAGSGSKLSVTAGDVLCLTWECTAFTANSCTLRLVDQNASISCWTWLPYTGQKTGAGAIAAGRDLPMFALFYDDGAGNKESVATPVHASIFAGNGTVTTKSISSANPKMAGLRFQVPVPVTIDGAWVNLDNDVDVTPRLVKTGTTTNLITCPVLDKDQRQSVNGTPLAFRFAPVDLLANTTYRLLFENSGSATACAQYSFDVNSNGVLAGLGSGKEFYLSTSNTAFASLTGTDGTDYTDTNTTCPLIGLHVAKVHDGSGGGGMLVHPGMSGGMRG